MLEEDLGKSGIILAELVRFHNKESSFDIQALPFNGGLDSSSEDWSSPSVFPLTASTSC
jgi:hypothetical protein